MLKNNKSIKIQNLKRFDVIKNNNTARIDKINTLFNEYIAAGYVIYDVNVNSGYANLSGLAAGKYICVFFGDPTGTSGSPYVFAAAYFTAHADVIVTGLKLDSNYNIVKHSMDIYFNSAALMDLLGKVTFFAGNIFYKSTRNLLGIGNIRFASYTGNDPSVYIILKGTIIENAVIKTVLKIYFSTLTIIYITNSIVGFIDTFGGGGATFILTNVLFGNTDNSSGINFSNGNNIELKNVTAYNTIFYMYNITVLNNNNTLYYDGNTVTLTQVSNSYENVKKLNYVNRNYLNWTNYCQELILSVILTANNYTTASVVPTYTKKSIRGYLGTIKRNYYQFNFNPLNRIADNLKYNDDNDLVVWYRDDVEANLTSALIVKIKNYQYYKTDGTTAGTTFRDSESYLIIAERDVIAGTYAVFAFHKGQLQSTLFSEVWDNELYTITRVINILEYPEEISYNNLYNITDSPIEASYLMQDMTSKVVR